MAAVSRRQIIRMAVLGAAAVGLGGLGSILAACGGSAAPASSSAASGSAPASSAPPSRAPASSAAASSAAASPAASSAAAQAAAATLTVWHYSTAEGLKTVQDRTALFNKKYPKVKVDLVFSEFSAMPQRLIAAAGAKSGPDVIIYGGNEVVPLFKAGVFKDMDSYWSSYADKDKFPGAVISKFDGKVYGVKGYVNLTGLWYNKDILDAVGVQPPKTVDEVTGIFAKIAASGKKHVPMVLTGQNSDQGDWTAYPWLSTYGFSYKNPDQAAIQQAFTLVNEWARKAYLPKEVVNYGQAETFTRFAAGDVAFMENGNWNIGPAARKFKFKYGTAPLPTGPKPQGVFLGGEALWLGGFTKVPEVGWNYMVESLFTKEGQILNLKDSGSIPARTDLANAPEVTSNPLLPAYLEEVKDHGAEYPPEAGLAVAAQAQIAQNWSAVIAGQKSPAQAAKDAAAGVKANYKPT
ncbi:MAG: extracellular solute-binding protein [Chloroflexota bacterium]|nr:extracellular solute-binding protein [Chloroflexota bacterium]